MLPSNEKQTVLPDWNLMQVPGNEIHNFVMNIKFLKPMTKSFFFLNKDDLVTNEKNNILRYLQLWYSSLSSHKKNTKKIT